MREGLLSILILFFVETMNEQEFKTQHIGEFSMGRTMEMEPLDKTEATDLINMMSRFQIKTGSPFKIEEYAESVFILTDIGKLTGSDVNYFYKKNSHICNKIWFTQISPNKKVVNIYEDCPKKRRVYYAPYSRDCHFLNILSRTQSMSFILDN